MSNFTIESEAGILATLAGICAFFFWLERSTRWRLFNYLPPLIFIYLIPVIFSATNVLPNDAPVYDAFSRLVLPMMLVLLMLKVDIRGAVETLGRGVAVMLFGTLGVMVGAPIGLLVVKGWLGPDAWKAFGVLSGSWIGGTGNMAAVSEMIEAEGAAVGLAVIGDSVIYLFWLPILLASKNWASVFSRWVGVSEESMNSLPMANEVDEHAASQATPSTPDFLTMLAVAFAATWLADVISGVLPTVEPYLTASSWRVLLITAIGISLSLTNLRDLPASHELAMALVYLFVARMGAKTDLSAAAEQALPFLLGAAIWILIHGGFCLLGAKLMKVDIHTAAIASAANIGGAASATIVASHHDERLVPTSILMALLGYAVGNFAAYGTALICSWVA
ncbi:MAG: DUF819 family protein [Lacipirellulaceae bacterium]